MEVLANVDLSEERMAAIVAKENAVLAWGGRVNLSPADDVLISVERPLRLDTFEQMVASILSKKVAAGSTHLVIDIPVGPTSKVRSQNDAVRLRKLFEYIARHMGLITTIVFTDGSQPVGRGVGPVLEARDVMAVLKNESDAPEDLRDHAVMLAGHVLDFDPAIEGGKGYARDAQGRNPEESRPGELHFEVKAPRGGKVAAIDCERIARIARLAGAPMDKGAGIDLLHKTGAHVRDGEPLYRIHANSATGLGFARDLAGERSGYEIA
jgi:thymidine phosphorylase